MSLITSVTTTAGRVSQDLRASLHRARAEGEKRVLERRHRRALAVLGERVHTLAREGDIPVAALADQIAEVDARRADVEAARAARRDEDTGHDAVVAFPVLGDDAPA